MHKFTKCTLACAQDGNLNILKCLTEVLPKCTYDYKKFIVNMYAIPHREIIYLSCKGEFNEVRLLCRSNAARFVLLRRCIKF
jgi:hypothetical protein